MFKGLALVMLWVFGALLYQAVLHGEDYAMSLPDTKKRKGLPMLMEIRVRDVELDMGMKDIEIQLNEMAIEVIELQVTRGILDGIK